MKTIQVLFMAIFVTASVSSRSLDENKEQRLIKVNENQPGEWMTKDQVFNLIQENANFMDITDFYYANIKPANNNNGINAIPTFTRFNATVRNALTNLNTDRVEQFIRHFSNYTTRYHNSETGGKSQRWLSSQIEASLGGYIGQANVSEWNHGFQQNSIKARFEGSDPLLKDQIVILGAHLDSINKNGALWHAPGADDNASGSITILEALRAIVQAGIIPKRSIEFHWYAAEEIGLVGSQSIAIGYYLRNESVAAMLNFDVVSYHGDGIDDIGVYTDNGNAEVQQFMRILTDEYLDYGWRNMTCGYGCSDHASWTLVDYPAAMASAVEWNPLMHTPDDNIGIVNFTQVNEFIKLAIGFAIEMAEPISN